MILFHTSTPYTGLSGREEMLGKPFGSIPVEDLRNPWYLGMHIYQMIYTTFFLAYITDMTQLPDLLILCCRD